MLDLEAAQVAAKSGEHAAFSKEAADVLMEAGIIKTMPDMTKLADTQFIK